MTSVSSGDRPVGNIATVELPKTAHLSKEEYPKAANTVLHNTLVHCIVDSVTKDSDSVTEIKELSKNIDALLKVGSFYVKGWSNSPHESSDYNESSLMGVFYTIQNKQKGLRYRNGIQLFGAF